MPCYIAWTQYVEQGTPEYRLAEGRVRMRLESIKHIINYYYSAYDYPMPDLPPGTKVDLFRQPKSKKEQHIREAICHHVRCDGMSVTDLYDASSLLDPQDRNDLAYLAVILPCASLLAPGPDEFKMDYMANEG